MKYRRYFVSGRVQGVGFRWACVTAANQAGVSGWTRNLSDGRVEVLACGTDGELDSLARWLESGPAGARVEHLEIIEEHSDVRDASWPRDFVIRR